MRFVGISSLLFYVFCALFAVQPARAEFGSQPIKIIFPFAAGGSGDAVARLLAERIRNETGQAVVVENRTGAAGRLGVQAVRSAEPDGTTLLLTPFTLMVIYPHIYSSLGYDPIADFAPISQIASFEFALAVAKGVPARSLPDFINWVKANPSQGTYGTPGAGTLPHFFGIGLSRAAGLDLRHIGYRGASAAIADLVAGQLPIAVLSTADVLEHHKAESVRIIATFDKARSPYVPDLPTIKESGFDLSGNGWFALYAPVKTPGGVVDRINRIVLPYVQSEDFKKRLLALGLLATGTTAQDLAQLQRQEAATWEPLVRSSGFKPAD